jgi:hypothetical protein
MVAHGFNPSFIGGVYVGRGIKVQDQLGQKLQDPI